MYQHSPLFGYFLDAEIDPFADRIIDRKYRFGFQEFTNGSTADIDTDSTEIYGEMLKKVVVHEKGPLNNRL
ncbi:MAG: hypothetical protein K2J80_01395 [Oscillospiraceae bacterium]|nr:hypothetical protein [Oscillospiraceae bacterium]